MLFRGNRLHRCEPAAFSAIGKLELPADLSEQRVVGADAHVQPWLDPRAALPDDDRAAGDDLAGELLHAQPLRIGVAPVCRTSATLFMCHCPNPLLEIRAVGYQPSAFSKSPRDARAFSPATLN